MNTTQRIHDEVKRLPEDLADRVLDFVLFLEQRHGVGNAVERANGTPDAMDKLFSNPIPLKEGVKLPVEREALYDRSCLR
ncbi:MAG: hypothetical protein HQL96_12850 [Magnetococcales bacterium]|nr:hypothetical protein [Magnetococcales bacterium]